MYLNTTFRLLRRKFIIVIDPRRFNSDKRLELYNSLNTSNRNRWMLITSCMFSTSSLLFGILTQSYFFQVQFAIIGLMTYQLYRLHKKTIQKLELDKKSQQIYIKKLDIFGDQKKFCINQKKIKQFNTIQFMGAPQYNLKTQDHDFILYKRFMKDEKLLQRICSREQILITHMQEKTQKNIRKDKKNIFKQITNQKNFKLFLFFNQIIK